jgi:hypothetical protein
LKRLENTLAERVVLGPAQSIREQERPPMLAIAELPEHDHVGGWQGHSASVLCLPGALTLQSKSLVRLGADVQHVPFEEEVPHLGESDFPLACHAMEKEFEDHLLLLMTYRREFRMELPFGADRNSDPKGNLLLYKSGDIHISPSSSFM